jgi:hypothetical protein
MRTKKTPTIASTTNSNWYPVNDKQENFNIGIQVVVSGSLTWIVQTTNDDIFDTTITPTAIAAAAPLDTGTSTEMGNITVPCRAVRLNVTYTSGTGAYMIINQGS